MNQGGEPAHDDYGLPWVDIEIPDDARELDRDVQAYHRELRAVRRIERSNRWRAPLRKSSMLVPLIAGCLVLAMIGGMVLTMFSTNPEFGGAGRHHPPVAGGAAGAARSRQSAKSAPASAGAPPPASAAASAAAAASVLPAGTIAAVGGAPISLRALYTVAIAIVPGQCQCSAVITRLLDRAKSAGVKVYLVGLRGSKASALRSLAPRAAVATAVLAIDANDTLRQAYKPGSLTVLLVDRNHHVRPAVALSKSSQIDRALHALG
ncbi:MAG TPA: hypothetical protein VF843_15745 [Streptosporangiaceae bacterium]